MNPPSSSSMPASSNPRPSVLGIEPSARMQWLPVTSRPSVSLTVTTSPERVTDSIRDLLRMFIP